MNKHLKIAFFMAPVLALIAYGVTGYYQPKAKEMIGDYELRATSLCNPTQNTCLLISGKFELKLVSSIKKGKTQLAVISNEPVSVLSLAMGINDEYTQFKMMKSDDLKYWQVFLNEDQILNDFKKVRLAAHAKKANYFIETNIYF